MLSPALQRVAERFKSQLPKRLEALSDQAKSLTGLEAEETLIVMERALHDLAGTAPTLGFTDLGRIAREIERDVQQVRLQGCPITASQTGDIQSWISRLTLVSNPASC